VKQGLYSPTGKEREGILEKKREGMLEEVLERALSRTFENFLELLRAFESV